MKIGFFLLLIIISISGWSQAIMTKTDLRKQLKVLGDDGELTDYNRQKVNAIHLYVSQDMKGGIIYINSPDECSLFINGKLLKRFRSHCSLKVDSLIASQSGVPLMSLFQENDVKSISVSLERSELPKDINTSRPATYFKDFIILSSLLLFGFFVILFRSNSRLTIDYLNLIKVFSIQEREEAIVTGRIGSSVNILFFVFISLLSGLLLIITFSNGPLFLRIVQIESISGSFGWWLLISLFVFVFLIIKLILVWAMSALFAFRGVVRFQFFNFIRSLYVAATMMGLAMMVYYMLEIEKPDFFYFLLVVACSFLILGSVFIYFKLMDKTSVSGFHLFSYLCGSEIISLMILVKVLLI